MKSLEDARALAQAAQQVVADLENEAAEGGDTTVTSFDSSAIVNADGSIIITLTPTAPANVSDADVSSGSETPAGATSEVTEVPAEPGPTGPSA